MATTGEATVAKRVGLLRRLKLFLQVWLFKVGTVSMFRILRTVYATKTRQSLPTYTKRYAIRPSLEHRVFVPPSAKTPGAKVPLLISIHGGGFILCDPQCDDETNRYFADKHGFLVVSINYRLAPRNTFPDSVHDVAEVVRAVLADPDLPIDTTKVAICGFSAGGNLTLAVAQLPGIKDKVQALVPFYPVVDFTGKYKGPYRTTKDGKPDMLKDIGAIFTWAYVPPGQDLADTLLSPVYASREQIPQRVFFVAAEYDYLAHEAGLMAKKLAGVGVGDDATETEELGSDWEKNGVRWRLVPDVIHGWTHMEGKGDAEVARRKGLDVLYQDIADWLNQ